MKKFMLLWKNILTCLVVVEVHQTCLYLANIGPQFTVACTFCLCDMLGIRIAFCIVQFLSQFVHYHVHNISFSDSFVNVYSLCTFLYL